MIGLTAEHARISKLANDLFDSLTAKLETAEAHIVKLEAALALAKSMILGGEKMSFVAEEMFKNALKK